MISLVRSLKRPLLAAVFAGLAAAASANTAIQPVPRDANWVKRHDGFVAIAKQGGIDVVFIGDSITDGWRREAPKGGKAVWDAHFAPLKAANFASAATGRSTCCGACKTANSTATRPRPPS